MGDKNAPARVNAGGTVDACKGGIDMVERTCSIEDCDRPVRTRGWCYLHYIRWWKHGDPTKVLPLSGPVSHGHSQNYSQSPTYNTWRGMKQRCLNPNAKGYQNYGGRGITIHPAWIESFEAFLADMGERPEGLSLDRIDNDGNYEPGNCRWSTRKEQRANNERRNR